MSTDNRLEWIGKPRHSWKATSPNIKCTKASVSLAVANGTNPGLPTCVNIKGTVGEIWQIRRDVESQQADGLGQEIDFLTSKFIYKFDHRYCIKILISFILIHKKGFTKVMWQILFNL